MAKIAISTENNNVSAHFGRCPHYSIFHIEDNTIKSRTLIDTPPHQPGLLPTFLNEKGVTCVISGGMGPRAQGLFKEFNIQPIIGVSGPVDQVIASFMEGTLKQGESMCNHGQPGHSGQCGDGHHHGGECNHG